MELNDIFIQHPDGCYEPKRRITVKAEGGEVTLWPGQKLAAGSKLLGVPLEDILHMDVDGREDQDGDQWE